MSFDEIFDLTAGVCFNFYNILCANNPFAIFMKSGSVIYLLPNHRKRARKIKTLTIIIFTVHAGFIVSSVHRMIIIENRPVDPDNIQGSHRSISFMRITYITRANDLP